MNAFNSYDAYRGLTPSDVLFNIKSALNALKINYFVNK